MRIGRYEFGLIKPLRWHKYWKTAAENPCGCTIWEFGFWYFSILRYECAGEPDTRPPKTEAELATMKLLENLERRMFETPLLKFQGIDAQIRSSGKVVSKSEMKRQNVLRGRPMMEGISELKPLSPAKVKRAKKALKKLDTKIKPKQKRRKKKKF